VIHVVNPLLFSHFASDRVKPRYFLPVLSACYYNGLMRFRACEFCLQSTEPNI